MGYRFEAHIVTCNIDVALARAAKRESETKRHIPPQVLIERHNMILKLLPEIEVLAESFEIYQNDFNNYKIPQKTTINSK